jgi:basic amino acid/polyamine antiporter, APA family
MSDNTHLSFKKNLNLVDSTAIVVGSMIGSGIFIVSADMARTLGSPGWLLVAWLITGFMTVMSALSYGELASMMPKAGGQYVYLREAYNPFVGFLYGWTLFMVIQTGTIAAVAMAFAKFLGVMIPWVGEGHILLKAGPLSISTVHVIAVSSVILLTWINTRGIKTGKTVQNAFTFTKVLILLLFLTAGFFFAGSVGQKASSEYFWQAASLDKTTGAVTSLSGIMLIAAIGMAMVGSLFTCDAWNNIAFASGEVINPKRTVPLAMFWGTLIAFVLFFLSNVVYVKVLPLRGMPDGSSVIERGMAFATRDRLGTATISSIFGEYAAFIMAALVVISTFGCNNGLILSGARVYYAMSEDNLFFKGAGKLNKHDVPGNGLIIQCIWASLLCLSGSYGQLLDYVVFAVLIFYVLTILGIFVLRKKKPEEERTFRAFGYPVVQIVYVLLAVAIMVILLVFKPERTWPGLLIVLIGIPVYYLWRKFGNKRATAKQIGTKTEK